MEDIFLAKIITEIMSSGVLCTSTIGQQLNVIDMSSNLMLISVLLNSHKKRFLNCFTEDQRSAEISNLVKNYHTIFGKQSDDLIQDELLTAIFRFITSENLRSALFPEICVNMMSLLDSCNIKVIKIVLFRKIMHAIIHGVLYGKEPFDSILVECINNVENAESEPDIFFLE